MRCSRPRFSCLVMTLFTRLLQSTADVQQLTAARAAQQTTASSTMMTSIKLTHTHKYTQSFRFICLLFEVSPGSAALPKENLQVS